MVLTFPRAMDNRCAIGKNEENQIIDMNGWTLIAIIFVGNIHEAFFFSLFW